jgi:putative transposase
MRYDPDRHQPCSIRLMRYNYAQAGAYFVTICTQNRCCLFGEAINGDGRLNAAGRMIDHWWRELSTKLTGVELDHYVIMPNHLHGVLILDAKPASHVGADLRVRPALPTLVQWFKTMTTNAYIRGVRENEWPAFAGKLWQRTFYDRVIRDEAELDATRQYILTNPLRWHLDPERSGL